MLFKVEMEVHIPPEMPKEEFERLKREEKDRAMQLQRDGIWRHLWRIAGQYANVSIFDVESIDQLHDILTGLPLFPFMKISVVALCRHPSSIREGDL